MIKPKSIARQTGATLLEILIALIILMTGVLIMTKFQSDITRSRSSINQQSEAMLIATNKLDGLRHYVVLNSAAGSPAYEDISSGNSTVTGMNGTYNLNWTVTENMTPSYKTIRVTVTWTDQSNQTQNITLDSIIGKMDPTASGRVMQNL